LFLSFSPILCNLQVSGAGVYRYWIATYIWDALLFLGLSLLVMLVLSICTFATFCL